MLEDADQKLSRLWELTPVQRYVKREFVRSVLEELSLGVDDTLISVLVSFYFSFSLPVMQRDSFKACAGTTRTRAGGARAKFG